MVKKVQNKSYLKSIVDQHVKFFPPILLSDFSISLVQMNHTSFFEKDSFFIKLCSVFIPVSSVVTTLLCLWKVSPVSAHSCMNKAKGLPS